MRHPVSRKSAFIFTGVFLILVGVTGILTLLNQVRVHVNHIEVNNEWTAEAGNKFETDLAANFFRKFDFVNLNGAVRKLLGQREMNGVFKLDNGYLTVPLAECPEDRLRLFADRTAAFQSYLRKRGTDLVYVSPPYVSDLYDPQLPAGTEDFSNANIDRLLALFAEKGIDTIDVRAAMHSDGVSHYDMVYRTDHHWTTEAGFYTGGLLERYIAEKTGCETDPRIFDISNYTVTKYENIFLGTRGKRTGRFFAGTDDYVLIEPDFETRIRNSDGVTGSIADFFIDMEPLAKADYENGYVYDAVPRWGAYAGNYVNLLSRNDVKVLMISDSYAKAVNPFLIMGFGEMNCWLNGNVSYITPEMVEDYDPDVVIMMYYPDYINAGSGSFDFIGF